VLAANYDALAGTATNVTTSEKNYFLMNTENCTVNVAEVERCVCTV